VATIIPLERDGVRGFLHQPDRASDRGLVLTHGAGSNCDSPLLVEVAAVFAAAGLSVLRCDLPFRQRRSSGPPSPASAAGDRAGLKAAIEVMRGIGTDQVVLAGHSYGGRQASMLAADEPDLARGLLLLSYPLHPPRRPTSLRTEHFSRLIVPSVFVHGTADPFGSPEELRAAMALIPAATTPIIVDGAGHDLKRGRFDLSPIVAAVLDRWAR
jgi:predicted alpha/beta-hydrolase family hydrolase